MPIEPPPTSWLLPAADVADETEIVGVGADLEPGTLLAAYRGGLFPMRHPRNIAGQPDVILAVDDAKRPGPQIQNQREQNNPNYKADACKQTDA